MNGNVWNWATSMPQQRITDIIWSVGYGFRNIAAIREMARDILQSDTNDRCTRAGDSTYFNDLYFPEQKGNELFMGDFFVDPNYTWPEPLWGDFEFKHPTEDIDHEIEFGYFLRDPGPFVSIATYTVNTRRQTVKRVSGEWPLNLHLIDPFATFNAIYKTSFNIRYMPSNIRSRILGGMDAKKLVCSEFSQYHCGYCKINTLRAVRNFTFQVPVK